MEDKDIIQGEPIYYAFTLNPEFKELLFVPLSDAHYGNPLFSRKHFLQTVLFINNTPNAYTVLNGDLCESSIRTSKGEIYKQVGSPQEQRDQIIEWLMPIKDRVLGVTLGNHELRIKNEVGIDICQDIARELKVPYRAEGILLKISFGDNNKSIENKPFVYWCYATHGYGGARTAAAKAVKVERTSTFVHADFYVMSHDHVVNAAPVIYLMPDPRTHIDDKTGFTIGKVVAHRKLLIKTNAYLKWGGYSEIGGFPPTDLETPIIKLSGEGRPRVKVEI